jgi:hypothetical protein
MAVAGRRTGTSEITTPRRQNREGSTKLHRQSVEYGHCERSSALFGSVRSIFNRIRKPLCLIYRLPSIKSKHRRLFSSLPLYYRALHTISTQRYRLPVRRYVMELFDVRLDPSVVATLSSIAKSLASAQPATSPGHPPNLARTMSEEEEVSAGLRLGLNGLPDDMASFEEPEVRRKPGPPMKPKARFSGFDA